MPAVSAAAVVSAAAAAVSAAAVVESFAAVAMLFSSATTMGANHTVVLHSQVTIHPSFPTAWPLCFQHVVVLFSFAPFHWLHHFSFELRRHLLPFAWSRTRSSWQLFVNCWQLRLPSWRW